MYWRLFESLMTWYRDRGLGAYTYMLAAAVMSMCMLSNAVLIALLVSLVGSDILLNILVNPSALTCLYTALLVGNLLLTQARYGHGIRKGCHASSLMQSRLPAALYMTGSFGSLVVFFEVVALIKI